MRLGIKDAELTLELGSDEHDGDRTYLDGRKYSDNVTQCT
jgi:hypothetical protein